MGRLDSRPGGSAPELRKSCPWERAQGATWTLRPGAQKLRVLARPFGVNPRPGWLPGGCTGVQVGFSVHHWRCFKSWIGPVYMEVLTFGGVGRGRRCCQCSPHQVGGAPRLLGRWGARGPLSQGCRGEPGARTGPLGARHMGARDLGRGVQRGWGMVTRGGAPVAAPTLSPLPLAAWLQRTAVTGIHLCHHPTAGLMSSPAKPLKHSTWAGPTPGPEAPGPASEGPLARP